MKTFTNNMLLFCTGYLHREISTVSRRQMRLPPSDCMTDIWHMHFHGAVRRRSQSEAQLVAGPEPSVQSNTKRKRKCKSLWTCCSTWCSWWASCSPRCSRCPWWSCCWCSPCWGRSTWRSTCPTCCCSTCWGEFRYAECDHVSTNGESYRESRLSIPVDVRFVCVGDLNARWAADRKYATQRRTEMTLSKIGPEVGMGPGLELVSKSLVCGWPSRSVLI